MRRLAFLAVLFAAACTNSQNPAPTAPAAPVVAAAASFTGIWDLEYTVQSCGSPRPWYCPPVGVRKALIVRLLQSGSSVTGYLFSDTSQVARVDGTIGESSDEVQLSGTTPALEDWLYPTEVRGMRLSIANGVMTGRFEILFGGLTPLLIAGEMVAQRSHRPLPSTLDGEWVGTYVRSGCATPAGTQCNPFPVSRWETFRLVMAQTGARVSGTLELGTYRFAVAGTLTGDELVLQGTFEEGYGAVLVLARRDTVGGLTGQFTHTATAGSVVTADIRHVAQRP